MKKLMKVTHSPPTCEWGVNDGGVIEKPCGPDSVHLPALDAQRHSPLLTNNHAWWEDDSWHIEGLLFLWVKWDRAEDMKVFMREKKEG